MLVRYRDFAPYDDREIVLRAPEPRENPTRGPGRSGCVAIIPTRMKGLFVSRGCGLGKPLVRGCCAGVVFWFWFWRPLFVFLLGRVWGLLFVCCCYGFSRPPLGRRRAVRSQWPTPLRPPLGQAGLVALLMLRSPSDSRPFPLSLRTSVASLRCRLARTVRDYLRPISPGLVWCAEGTSTSSLLMCRRFSSSGVRIDSGLGRLLVC